MAQSGVELDTQYDASEGRKAVRLVSTTIKFYLVASTRSAMWNLPCCAQASVTTR